jgi:hypothetical protein
MERSYNVVRTLKRMIQSGISADETVVETKYYDELPIVIGPENDFGSSPYFYDAFLHFCSVSKQYRIDLRLPVGGMFLNFDKFLSEPSKPEYFFSVDPKGLDKRASGKYVSALQRGYYGQTGNVVERIQNFMQEHELKPAGPVYNMFLHDELSIDNPDNYLMQFTVAVL